MDYRWHKHGFTKDFFWYKAKADFTDILFKNLNLPKNQKILVVGSGTGFDLPVIKKYGQVYATDIVKKSIDLIPNNLVKEKKVADACNLPYQDNYFDMVVSFDVLEDIVDEQKALDETRRVLKKGGKFVFTLPAFKFLHSSYDEYNENLRRYDKKSVKELLKKFDKLNMGYWFSLLFFPAVLQRLLIKKSKFTNEFYNKIPLWMDKIFYKVLRFENWLISKRINFPFGLSIYGTCEK